jgi:hypothetical protein
MKHECKCQYCTRTKVKATIKVISMQQEFEATCFMYTRIENEIKFAVDNYNKGKPLTSTQKQLLANAIWRN